MRCAEAAREGGGKLELHGVGARSCGRQRAAVHRGPGWCSHRVGPAHPAPEACGGLLWGRRVGHGRRAQGPDEERWAILFTCCSLIASSNSNYSRWKAHSLPAAVPMPHQTAIAQDGTKDGQQIYHFAF